MIILHMTFYGLQQTTRDLLHIIEQVRSSGTIVMSLVVSMCLKATFVLVLLM